MPDSEPTSAAITTMPGSPCPRENFIPNMAHTSVKIRIPHVREYIRPVIMPDRCRQNVLIHRCQGTVARALFYRRRNPSAVLAKRHSVEEQVFPQSTSQPCGWLASRSRVFQVVRRFSLSP